MINYAKELFVVEENPMANTDERIIVNDTI